MAFSWGKQMWRRFLLAAMFMGNKNVFARVGIDKALCEACVFEPLC